MSVKRKLLSRFSTFLRFTLFTGLRGCEHHCLNKGEITHEKTRVHYPSL